VKSAKTGAKNMKKFGDSSLLKCVTTQRQWWFYT